MKEIVFAGSGGQGVLTAGLIISDIAATEGINVTWVPSYGSAMRGGTANCTVKYCENTIYNPSQEQPDLLLAMTGTIRAYFNEHPDHFDPRQYLKPARQAVKDMVTHKLINVLGCNGKA